MTAPQALVSNSPEDTRRMGERLGALLQPGDAVLLSGELGAGKTIFVQGVARGLGFEGSVSSKSFVLLGEYQGRFTLYHADLYRLEDPAQVQDLALDEISAGGILVVEWPERAGEDLMPADHLRIEFDVVSENTRCLRLIPSGDRGRTLNSQLVTHNS